MAATWADRKKLAALGAGRGDWLCIGTSLDAWGFGGASPPPAPTSRMLVHASCAWLEPVIALPVAGRLVGQFGALVRRSGTLGSRGLLSH